jgi:hypothetical protein
MQLSKQLGIPARRISGGKRIRANILKNESSAWNLTLRKTRRDAISDETKRIVYDFWLSPGISHPTGNKPDINRERLGPNIYASHMAQVIEKTQTDVYIDFVAKYPNKIRQKTFDKLKPFFVRPVSEKDRNTCCCRYHIESNLLLKSCMKFRKSKNQSETSEVESFPV